MYRDEELEMIFKKLGLAILVALIFAIPTALFVFNKFDNHTSDVIDRLRNEKVLVFVNGYKCEKCKTIKNILDDYNVDYYEINRDINHQDFKIIMNKIHVNWEDIPAPSLVLVEKGEMIVKMSEFNKKDLGEFFQEYELI